MSHGMVPLSSLTASSLLKDPAHFYLRRQRLRGGVGETRSASRACSGLHIWLEALCNPPST